MNRRKPDGLAARRHGSAEPFDSEDDAQTSTSVRSEDNQQEGCGCAGAGFPLLAEVCETEDDILAMCVLRFVLAGYCHDRMRCLDAAIDAAACVHGEPFALALLTRAVAVVRALRAERNGNFQYLPANCCRISEDEQELAAAMNAVLGSDRLMMAGAITVLSRSNHAPCIMQAVVAFTQSASAFAVSDADTTTLTSPHSTVH
jgi:hypothetical protein